MSRKQTALPAPPKRAALYLRFSSEKQGMNAYDTIDAQREFLSVWATTNRYQIVAEFRDEGKTGTNLTRPGYRALLAGAAAKQFDVVLVTFMDRLGRGQSFTIAQHELKQVGAEVVTALQSYTNDTGGYISQAARQLVDGIYPKLVREWTEAKMVAMLAQGYLCSGIVMYGYVAVPVLIPGQEGEKPPKRLIPDDAAADVYREAMRLILEGKYQADVKRYLDEATGEAWTDNRVKRLLTSRVYRGVATWGRHVNEAAHLPLVDEATWQAVQDTLESAQRPENYLSHGHGDVRYYLSGRIWCGCGGRMTPYWAKGRGGLYTYYQCMKHRDQRCTGAKQISAPKVHHAVFVEAALLAKNPWRLRMVMEQARALLPDSNESKNESLRLRRDLDRLKRERDRFKAAVRVAPMSALKILTQQMGANEVEIAQSENALHLVESSVQTTQIPTLEECRRVLSLLGDIWAYATDEQRAEIAAKLIDEVTVNSKETLTARLVLVGDKADLRSTREEVRPFTYAEGHSQNPALTLGRSNPSTAPLQTITLPLTMGRKRGTP